ncbi:MAG: glycosyltransferase family 4 protein [Bacteroidales bacterium]|jgi:glycosyltransferase involved in cell wall biosynthesis|nr:glycosyltransferase family 4 protein [Bacteroidales bacterium]
MNILQICNKFPYPLKDGGVIAAFSMLKGFYVTGHDVTVLAINTSKHYTDVDDIPFEITQMANFHQVYKNTHITFFGALWNLCFSQIPYTASRFLFPKFKNKLKQVLSQNKFEIIQIEGLYMCAYIPFIRQFSDAQIVYRAHNVECEIWDRLWRETKNPVKKCYIKTVAKRVERFERKYINMYDLLVSITQRDADKYYEMGNVKPYFVAPTGVFVEEMNVVQKDEVSSLFHIGGLDWAPNQQGLVWFLRECWPKIHEKYPQLRCSLAGRNAPGWFVEEMNVSGVEFVGEVSNAKDYMMAQDIMVVPLMAGSGMRIKIIEGMAYGKTIVSTSIGAEGIPAKPDAEIVIANNVDEFVDKISDLVDNPVKVYDIAKNARTFVRQKFDNYSIIQELVDFYFRYVFRN